VICAACYGKEHLSHVTVTFPPLFEYPRGRPTESDPYVTKIKSQYLNVHRRISKAITE